MPTYNKLVRDLIPEIIDNSGKTAHTKYLTESEHREELLKKFTEELEEYKQADTKIHQQEELADLLELIHALAELDGLDMETIEKTRQEKAHKRGSFRQGIFLMEVDG